jgi:hypothetical protein
VEISVMPITRTYECPDCLARFPFLHMNSDEPPPEHCPRCGNYMGVDPKPMPSLFSIKSKVSKSADSVYRAMEDASAERAAVVQEMTGEDASNMKITNMNDHQRHGDIAAKTPANEVSKVMAAAPNVLNFQNNQVAQGFASQTAVGPYPHMGDTVRQNIGMSHFQRAASVTRNGNIGVHKGSRK